MDDPNYTKSIASDRIFMDDYYVYMKSRAELRSGIKKDEKMKIERISCEHYLKALNYCLAKISELPNGEVKDYHVNYIRWNQDVIEHELQYFESIPHLDDLFPKIVNCRNMSEMIIQNYSQLTEQEKATVNEYVHAYELIKRCEDKSGNVYRRALEQTGRLFINYLKVLSNHGCIHEFHRDNIYFNDIREEAEYLVTELENINDDLKKKVEKQFKFFKNFRTLDDACAKCHEQIIKEAVELSHSRATENMLQTMLSQIKEINKTARKRIQTKCEDSPFANALIHRSSVLKNCSNMKEIIRYAKENPWKMSIFVAGSTISSVMLGIVGPVLTVSAIGIFDYYKACYETSVEIREEIVLQRRKAVEFSDKFKKMSKTITENVIKDGQKRAIYRQWRNGEEIDDTEDEIEEERESLINPTNQEQRARILPLLNDDLQQIEMALSEAQANLNDRDAEFSQTEQLFNKLQEGLNAVHQLSQKNGNYHPLP
uniref:Uncharacterized protein n=1 Tax=Panagrolaimus sp. JU765 TaxID=591449 RepID=A0AC34R380_9BILA